MESSGAGSGVQCGTNPADPKCWKDPSNVCGASGACAACAHDLSCCHAADDLEAGGGVHHFEQAGVLLGDEGGLLGAHQVAGERAGERSLEQDVLDVDEGQAGGDVGKFIRSEFGRA